MSSSVVKLERNSENLMCELLQRLSDEVAKVAADIETLPVIGSGQMSNEDFVTLQKIDLSSQKLRDFSSLIDHVAKHHSTNEIVNTEEVQAVVTLEYSKDMIADL